MLTAKQILRTRELRLASNDSIVIQYSVDEPTFNVYSVENKSKTSVDTGSFTKGVFRINPYYHSRSSLNGGGDGNIETRQYFAQYYYRYKFTGDFALLLGFNVPTIGVDEFSNFEQIALQRAYSKLGQSAFAGGENLGELKETLQMLRHPLKDLRDFFLKNGGRNLRLFQLVYKNRRHHKRILVETGKTVSSTWLEIRYGLRPLVNSLIELVKVVNSKVEEFDPDRIRTARALVQDVRTSANTLIGGSSQTLLVNGRYAYNTKIKARGVVYFQQAQALSPAKHWGFSLSNLPEISWELTRLSFVVDWFLTVGPWIESFRINPEITILGSTTSIKLETQGDIFVTSVAGAEVAAYVVKKDLGLPARFDASTYRRTVNPPKPSLPLFRRLAGLDFPKTVDGLALLLQGYLHKLRK